MSAKRWISEKVAEWIITGLLGVTWATVLTSLKLHESSWAVPLMYGTGALCMTFVCGGLYIAISRIPRLRTKVTTANVEGNIRNWLDRSGCSVKTDSAQETFFRFCVQLPSGSTVLIGRPRAGLVDHVIVRANIVDEKTVPKELQSASLAEQERLLGLIKLELARARVGYFGLSIPVSQQFSIGKNVRITDYLSEEDFMRAVWDVEAAVHAVLAIYGLWLRSMAKQ